MQSSSYQCPLLRSLGTHSAGMAGTASSVYGRTSEGEVGVRNWLENVLAYKFFGGREWQFLVNVLVAQHAWQPKHSRNISIKSTYDPESPLSLLPLDGIEVMNYMAM